MSKGLKVMKVIESLRRFSGFVLLRTSSLTASGCTRMSATQAPTHTLPLAGYPVAQTVVAYPSPRDTSNDVLSSDFSPIKTYEPGVFPSPPEPSDPNPGMGSISGILFSTTYNGVIPQTMFYLTPGIGEDHDEVPPVVAGPGSNDLTYKSDENGQFNLSNIPPGKYYLVMSAPPYDWALGYKDTNLNLLRIDVEAGSKINCGIVFIYWP